LGQPAAERSAELQGTDLATFHYGDWLLERGYDFTESRESTPLFADYYRFQCLAIKEYFAELARYAREYGREQGREVLVSGNFFNLDSHYLALADDVDLLITEMRNTTYRQPEWYRYVAGFAGDKDVVVVENPYGGVVPELVEALKHGRGHDLLRLSLFEAAAMGANMSVSYGAWMGSRIEDAFYAPHELATEVQTFLADNEDLYTRTSYNSVAVAFSVESNRDLIAKQDSADNVHNLRDESVVVPYRVVTGELASAGVPFDVVLFPDGVTAADRVATEALTRYETLIVPAVTHLTAPQAAALRGYLDGGGRLVVTGDLGSNLPEDERLALLDHAGTVRAELHDVDALLPAGRQVRVSAPDVAVNIARLADGSAAVHLVNYGYDEHGDRVAAQSDVELTVSLPLHASRATVLTAEGKRSEVEVTVDAGRHTLRLESLGVYAAIVLAGGAEAVQGS
jgi:hypothetical protein